MLERYEKLISDFKLGFFKIKPMFDVYLIRFLINFDENY